MRVLITGTAGFIGFHLARRLIADGHEVAGVDGFTTYYDVELKRARHAILKGHNAFSEHVLMLEQREALEAVARAFAPEAIVHLAAQAGVRYSLEQPRAYIDANLVGSFNVLELAREQGVNHLLLASTSSAYGANTDMPFGETDPADHPLTLYAATKKGMELMSHSYSHLWGIPTTVFRFFTVYGPWGRPDMALFKFVDATLNRRPIDLYNNGDMVRDFTYIDDLVEAIVRLLGRAPRMGEPIAGVADSLSPVAPWRLVNIGGGNPVKLTDYIEAMEAALGRKASFKRMPMQKGDVPATFADVRLLEALTAFRPATPVAIGVRAFCDWYLRHYNIGPASPPPTR
jgi:UDP-glucuronate 4-epimerase